MDTEDRELNKASVLYRKLNKNARVKTPKWYGKKIPTALGLIQDRAVGQAQNKRLFLASDDRLIPPTE